MNLGDVVDVDFGIPIGSEAGYSRPGIVLNADAFLRFRPTTIFVVPLTSTLRTFPSHVAIDPDETNGLAVTSYALVEQLRAVAVERTAGPTGNVGPGATHQILEILALVTGMG